MIIWNRRSNSWLWHFWMRMEINHHQRSSGTEVALVLEVFKQFWRMSSLVSQLIWWNTDFTFLFSAIQKILEEWRPDYKPGITFICTVRNHRQKMFAANEKDMVGEGKNVPAGTAMTGYGGGTPDSFHFHLCSHAGIGTVNPTFYQVLHDDNDLELDNVVKMTNALTLDSKRCEKRYVSDAVIHCTNCL